MQTTNQVRQILMNELGLTRDSVRKIAEDIVTKTVDRHMESLVSSGKLNQITEEAFQRKYRDPKYGYAEFKSLISEAAAKAAKQFVADAVVVLPKP